MEHSQFKPPSQICSICLEDVDVDEIKNGMPNCVTCKNGHFIHRECYDKMNNRKCPQCREDVQFNCRGTQGYLIPNRKGGKRKSLKKRRNTRKRKSMKKRHNTKRH